MSQNHKQYRLNVHGMHCQSCVLLIEENLKTADGVVAVSASLSRQDVLITGELGNDLRKISESLTKLVENHGYKLSLENGNKKKWEEFWYALPIAILFILGFVLLQRAGLVNLVNASEVTYGTAILIGVIASLSTCLAVVGGLVLSLSANYAKSGDKWKPQILFHAGRLIGFFVLGGVIGVIGSSFRLGGAGNFVLSLIVALIMIILGINLLDVIHSAKRLQISMPKVLARHTMNLSTATHFLAPFLVGVLTFFLPCGFTQSMQVYTLTTGSFWTGALTMFTFALGTFPVLALLSFSSFSIAEKPWKGVFFKTAGLVVIALAIFNFINAMVAYGLISPVFNL